MFVLSRGSGGCRCGTGRGSSWGSGRSSAPARSLLILRLSPGFDYWIDLLPPLLVFSLGLSLIVAPLTATVLADAGEHDAGIASGVNNAIARIAGLLGIAIVGAAIAGLDNKLDLPGFRPAMAITAGLVAVGGVIGLAGIRNRRDERRRGDRLRPGHQALSGPRRARAATTCR